jgi:hypothetical protein
MSMTSSHRSVYLLPLSAPPSILSIPRGFAALPSSTLRPLISPHHITQTPRKTQECLSSPSYNTSPPVHKSLLKTISLSYDATPSLPTTKRIPLHRTQQPRARNAFETRERFHSENRRLSNTKERAGKRERV